MIPWLEDPNVAVIRERPGYARTPPYAPSEPFPEWPEVSLGREDNPAYRAVRRALHHLGFDAARFGTAEWNPLGEIIRPGVTVVLKPNFVSHRNLAGGGTAGTEALVTHGSFLRAVLDYVAKALGGRGRVLVGDCPIQGTRWAELARLVGLLEILEDARRRFPGVEFLSRDWRLTRARFVGGRLVARERTEAHDDEYRELDLGRESLLVPLMNGQFEFGVPQYPRIRMRRAHGSDTNRYVMPREVLDADVFLNLPKMKSHQKAGITCALKNLVGVNGHKDYLPHFRFGSPKQGGDEYPDGDLAWDLYWKLVHAEWELDRGARKLLLQAGALAYAQLLRRVLRVPRSAFAQAGGSWHGNDTLWRTVLDINRAFLYYDPASGTIGSAPVRRYLALVDGLVGGQCESPLAPSPVAAGFVLAARNPLALDTVAAALMGFDWRALRQIERGYALSGRPLAAFEPDDISLIGCPGLHSVGDVYQRRAFVRFAPSHGWRGHVEYDGSTPVHESRLQTNERAAGGDISQ